MIFLATGLPWQCLIYKNKQKLLWVNFHKQLNISHDWPNIRKSRISVIFFCLTDQSVFMCVQIFSDIHMNVYKTRIKSGRCMSLVENRETESEKKWPPNVFFFTNFSRQYNIYSMLQQHTRKVGIYCKRPAFC